MEEFISGVFTGLLLSLLAIIIGIYSKQ